MRPIPIEMSRDFIAWHKYRIRKCKKAGRDQSEHVAALEKEKARLAFLLSQKGTEK